MVQAFSGMTDALFVIKLQFEDNLEFMNKLYNFQAVKMVLSSRIQLSALASSEHPCVLQLACPK